MQPCAGKMVEIIKWKFSGVNSAKEFPPDYYLREASGGKRRLIIPCARRREEIIKWKFFVVNSAREFPPDYSLHAASGGNNQVEIYCRQ
jgi:hypothetical protein